MADIIKFQEYVYSKEEKKKCIKKISALSTRSKNIKSILHNIGSSIECSLIYPLTKLTAVFLLL